MTTLALAVDSTQAVQGVSALAKGAEDLGRKLGEATAKVDELETDVGDLNKQLDTSKRATGALADENKKLKDALNGSQAQFDAAAQKARQFQQAAGSLTELQSIGARAKILGDEIGNLGTSFGSTARVGQAFAGVLLDLTQVGDKAKGGFGSFVSLLSANPLLAAAGVISAIATAMSLFASSTDTANDKLEKQISLQEDLRKASQDLGAQLQRSADLQRIGFDGNAQEQQLLRAKRLADVASGFAGQSGVVTIEELSRLTGRSAGQLTSLARERNLLPEAPYGGAVQMTGVGGAAIPAPGEVLLPANVAREVLLLLAQQLREQAASFRTEQAPGFTGVLSIEQIRALQDIQRGARDTGTVFGPPRPENLPGPYTGSALPTVIQPAGYSSAIGPQPGPDYMSPQQLSAYQKQFAPPTVLPDPEKLRQDAEELERFNEKLREMKSLGQDVGAAIGGAFFSIVNGAANARQALAALLQSFVAIAQQRAIQGIANSIGNAFGSTISQNNANAQTPGTASSGTSLRAGTTPP